MRILIAIDGSRGSAAALDTASALRWPAGTTAEVVTVIPPPVAVPAAVLPEMVVVETDAMRERAARTADAVATAGAARLRTAGLEATATVLRGRPAPTIVDRAEQLGADLIVLGARGHGVLERLLLGSVSSEVVDLATSPVLVARRGRVDRAVIAMDDSAEAAAAAEFVRTREVLGDADIEIVTAVDLPTTWWLGFTPGDAVVAPQAYLQVVEAARSHAERIVGDAADRWSGRTRPVHTTVREGPAATVVLDVARTSGADLIVMGTRDRGLVARTVLGSTARTVLHHADASVLIVHGLSSERSAEPVPLVEVG